MCLKQYVDQLEQRCLGDQDVSRKLSGLVQEASMCADYMARQMLLARAECECAIGNAQQVASHANGINGELSSAKGDLERAKLQEAEMLRKLRNAEDEANSNRQRLQELEVQLSSSKEESDYLRAKLSQACEAKSEFSGFVISCSSLCSSAQCKTLKRMLLQGMWRRC